MHFFSHSTPNLLMVILAMDHLDLFLTTAALNEKYLPSIQASVTIGKKLLNKYYIRLPFVLCSMWNYTEIIWQLQSDNHFTTMWHTFFHTQHQTFQQLFQPWTTWLVPHYCCSWQEVPPIDLSLHDSWQETSQQVLYPVAVCFFTTLICIKPW